MKRIAMAAVLLSGLVACDTTGSSFGIDTGLGTFDTALTLPGTDFRSDGMGTQVGSEGFWGCPIVSEEPIGDRTTPIADIGGSPIVLASARMGPWPLQIQDAGASAPLAGTLVLADGNDYRWVDVAEGEGCYDHLAVAVLGTIARGETSIEPVSGWLAIRDGASRLIVTSDASFATTSAAWGMPATLLGTPSLRIDAALDATLLDGQALYVECERTEIACAGAEVRATLIGERNPL